MRTYLISIAVSLLVGPAFAQDWSGGYVGVHGGGQGGSMSVTNSGAGVPPGPYEYDIGGGIGGVTAGYNWLAGENLLLGLEADLGFMSVAGSGFIASSVPGHHQDLTLDDGMLGDITARLGFGIEDTLFYAKGGIAYFSGQAEQATTRTEYSSTPTGGFAGYTIGAGVEHFVTDEVSIKAEYQHYAFGAEQGHQTSLVDDPPTPAGTTFPNTHEFGIDTIKIGVNFHF